MFTRCPNCNAAFSITGQQLVIAAGMVRCGICEHVFDARPYLFQESSNPPEINQVVEEPSTEFKQNKLSKDDLGLIDELNHETHEPVEEDSEEPLIEHSDREQPVPNIIAEEISNLVEEPNLSQTKQMLGVGFAWILLFVLAVQLIAAFKPSAFPEKLGLVICNWLTCVEKISRAPNKIEILNRSVHTHPHKDNALMTTLTIVNRANVSQAYPVIQLRFLDLSGNIIAARVFDANHYLGAKWNPETMLPPNIPISIQLEVQDTGEQVVSYDFEFL